MKIFTWAIFDKNQQKLGEIKVISSDEYHADEVWYEAKNMFSDADSVKLEIQPQTTTA